MRQRRQPRPLQGFSKLIINSGNVIKLCQRRRAPRRQMCAPPNARGWAKFLDAFSLYRAINPSSVIFYTTHLLIKMRRQINFGAVMHRHDLRNRQSAIILNNGQNHLPANRYPTPPYHCFDLAYGSAEGATSSPNI